MDIELDVLVFTITWLTGTSSDQKIVGEMTAVG